MYKMILDKIEKYCIILNDDIISKSGFSRLLVSVLGID